MIGYLTFSYAQFADHHMHIRSEDGTAALVRILEEVQGRKDVELEPSVNADHIIELLDSTGTDRAVLLPVSYFFAMPDVKFANEKTLLRRENEYTARQAATYPERLIAFCAVNPLNSYALEEIRRCGGDERVTGIKLHFANSGVDLRNDDHVEKVREVFEAMEQQNLAAIVHLWTRNPDFGAKDVEIFIHRILSESPSITVQIAHLGGPGSFSEVTHETAAAFADAIKNEEDALGHLYFDLAEVPHRLSRAQNEEQRMQMQKANRQLADALRKLGLERILWGSDWIGGPLPVYREAMNPSPLPSDIRNEILHNTAPYLD